jgi:hypothetical protein
MSGCRASSALACKCSTRRSFPTGERLQGLFYTCKLGEKLWTKPAMMLDELEALKAQLAAAADFGVMQSVQLSANRQELLVLGVTRRGLQRAEGRTASWA